MKLNSILNPRIMRMLIAIIEMILMLIAFIFVCTGRGKMEPIKNFEKGYKEWLSFYIIEIIIGCFVIVGLAFIMMTTFIFTKIGHWFTFVFHIFGFVLFFILALLGIILVACGDVNNSVPEAFLSKYDGDATQILEDTRKFYEMYNCDLKLNPIKMIEERQMKQQTGKYEIECYNTFENTHVAFIVVTDIFNWIIIREGRSIENFFKNF